MDTPESGSQLRPRFDSGEARVAPDSGTDDLLPRPALHARTDSPMGVVRHVLVCLDGSEIGEGALPYAVALAHACGARMSLLHVLEPAVHWDLHEPVDALEWEVMKSEAREYMDQIVRRLSDKGLSVSSRLLEGQAAEQVLRYSREKEVDLIALTSHGERGISDWSLSSNAEKIVARAGSSVLLVPSAWSSHQVEPQVMFRRILVPLDASPRAECVLPSLTSIAKSLGSKLILAHVVASPELTHATPVSHKDLELVRQLVHRNERAARSYLERLKIRLAREDIGVIACVETGSDVRQALCDIADREKVDTVVISARGQTGSHPWGYGSVARHMIGNGRAPLLVIRGAGHCEPPSRLDLDEKADIPAQRGPLTRMCRG